MIFVAFYKKGNCEVIVNLLSALSVETKLKRPGYHQKLPAAAGSAPASLCFSASTKYYASKLGDTNY